MSGNVLIVDDSLTVRMDLAEAFAAAGFTPIPCATVSEARDALGRAPVDVVILDVVLPDGDGVELLHEIRGRIGTGTPILMLSSEAEVRDRVRALQVGADEYVGKPYDGGYVVAKARELARARRTDAAPARTTVLVIDDSVTFREAVRDAVERAGHGVIVASSGEDGLRLAANHRPSAIVVDGQLPGIDGPTVIRRVRLDAALRRTPCVLLTASEDLDAELHALDAGADAFVKKQDELDVLLARLAAAMRAATADDAIATASLAGPHKILAVDDSDTYLDMLAVVLRGEGYDVARARSGEEALELLAVQLVDCILLDVMMPGLGGTETCRRIKAAPVVRDIPLILLTAVEDRAAMLEGLGAGADDYISKASELGVLTARVRAQIRRKQFEDENRRFREQLLRKELEAAEARAARELAETRAALADELERKNQELEAFSYSVSHDLRAPLRAIDGFTRAVVEDYGPQLDEHGRDYLARVLAASNRMGALIEDLLQLSKVGRAELHKQRLDLSAKARSIVRQLRERSAEREVDVRIADGIEVHGDPGLVRAMLENLLSNAWKFTSRREHAIIEVGVMEQDGAAVCFVRDNGVGFDANHAEKLFRPFQRLHTTAEFEGTGIGLATVQRIVARHGGRVWADGAQDRGATIYFTL